MSRPPSRPWFCLALACLVACTGNDLETTKQADSAESRWEMADFAHDASDLPMDEDILYGKLSNGLRYAVMTNDTPSRTATLLMRFDAGSLDESDDTRGIAHFLEHMAFNGSESIPEGEMIKRLERLGLAFGPDTNASTGFDQTTYQLELPEVSDALLDEALEIFRETAERLTLDPEAIERERGVILAEKRARNSPAFRAMVASLGFQTEGSGLIDRLPIGTVETINSVSEAQFRQFYEEQYRPEDTFIVLVGDRPAEQLAAKIETTFSDWTNDVEAVDDTRVPAIQFDEPRFGAFFDPEVINAVTLSTISYPKPVEEQRDTAENRAAGLPIYFANAMLNRRFAKRVRAGEASFTGAGTGVSDLFDAAEIASLQVTAEPDKMRDGFIEAERILRQAIDFGFTQSELEEQIANARKSWEVAVQTAPTRRTPSLARQILNSFASERVMTSAESSLARFDQTVEDLTLDDVNQALKDAWARVDTAPQLYLQSEDPIEDAETWLRDLLAESRSVSLEAEAEVEVGEFAYADWGQVGEVMSRTTIEDIGIETVEFTNGVRLNLKATPYERDIIRIRLRTGEGSAFYPVDNPAFGMQLGAVLGASAVGAHKADDLATILAGRTVGVNRSFGFRDMSLSGATVPDDLDLQLQLMAAYLTDPAYRPEVLNTFESQVRSVWSKLDSTPSGAASLEIPAILSSDHWSQQHPSETQALSVDLKQLSDWYATHAEGYPIEIAMVGDFDVDQVIESVAKTFGALPERSKTSGALPERSLNRVFPEGRLRPYEISHAGEPDSALLRIYWPIDDHENITTDRRFSALSSVLRLELNEVLREEEGATYSPSAFTSLPESLPNWGYLGVSVEVSPDELVRLTDLIESVANRLAEEGVDADTFDRALKPTLENIETSLENNSYWLNVIDEAQDRPETLNRHRTREADYTGMTPDDLSDLARQLFKADRAIRVHVRPET